MIIDMFYGLGNQMFIYTFGEYCRHILGMDVKYNLNGFRNSNTTSVRRPLDLLQFPNVKLKTEDSIFRPNFHLQGNIKNHIFKRLYLLLNGISIKRESMPYQIDEKLLDSLTEKDYVIGFFQTEKYAVKLEDKIRHSFAFDSIISPRVQGYMDSILESEAVSVHIRRGDYLNDNYFNVLSLDYYYDSISYIEKYVDNPHFFLFTDDVAWAKDNFKINGEVTFVEGNSGYDDMRLMSNCKHNIIANSSFSWWGAWLNSNPHKIVVAPSADFWYNDAEMNSKNQGYIPENWIVEGGK